MGHISDLLEGVNGNKSSCRQKSAEMSETTAGTAPNIDHLIVDTPEVVAAELGIASSSLNGWRRRKCGPPYIHLSETKIAYPRGASIDWMRKRMIDPAA